MNEFSSNIQNRDYKQQIGEEDKLDEWKKKSNQMLQEGGADIRIVNGKWHIFLNVFFVLIVLFILILASVFVYQVSEGKFKSSVTQTVEPQINNEVNNKYNFTSNTENEFNNNFPLNATIIINTLQVYTNSS